MVFETGYLTQGCLSGGDTSAQQSVPGSGPSAVHHSQDMRGSSGKELVDVY